MSAEKNAQRAHILQGRAIYDREHAWMRDHLRETLAIGDQEGILLWLCRASHDEILELPEHATNLLRKLAVIALMDQTINRREEQIDEIPRT